MMSKVLLLCKAENTVDPIEETEMNLRCNLSMVVSDIHAAHREFVTAAAKLKQSAVSAIIFSVGLPAPCPALTS